MKLCNYKGLTVGKNPFVEVTEEEVQNQINAMLKEKGAFDTKEGKSENGDVVNIDYKGLLDDVAFAGGTAEKYDLELGSGSFIPGFEEQLIGYSAGEDVDVHVTFPEQYHAPDLAGKAVVFKCHIHEVKSKVEPQFNDAFAQGFGIPTAAVLKEELTRQMNAQKKNDADNEYLNRLLRYIIDNSEIEVTEDAVKNRIDDMVSYYESQVAQYGMDLNTYLAMQQMTIESFRDQITEQAIASAKDDIIFMEISKNENLTVSEEEISRDLAYYKQYYQMSDEQFNTFVNEKKEEIVQDVMRRKVSILLIEENN